MRFLELRRKILEDMLGPSYDTYVNFKRQPLMPKKRQHRKRIPLWRFMLHLLNLDSASNLVQWIDTDDLKFKINQPIEVAELWGSIKDKSDMTYEKLGRAMRYYYGKNIIEKVGGLRYTYRFVESRKTKRYIEELAIRRCSIDSATDNETTAESDSVYSGEFDDSNNELAQIYPSSPSSFLNDDFTSFLNSNLLCLDRTNADSLQEKDSVLPTKTSNDDFSILDDVWVIPHEQFMDLEEIQAFKKQFNREDEEFTPETTAEFEKMDLVFNTANPRDVFLSEKC